MQVAPQLEGVEDAGDRRRDVPDDAGHTGLGADLRALHEQGDARRTEQVARRQVEDHGKAGVDDVGQGAVALRTERDVDLAAQVHDDRGGVAPYGDRGVGHGAWHEIAPRAVACRSTSWSGRSRHGLYPNPHGDAPYTPTV